MQLSNHIFNKSEIMWLCEEMNHQHESWERQLFTPVAISKRYGLHLELLRFWLREFKRGSLNICSSRGYKNELPILDIISQKRLSQFQKRNEILIPHDEIFHDFISDEIENTKQRRKRKRIVTIYH